MGANDLFIALLNKYKLPDGIALLKKLQLTKLYHHLNDNVSQNDDALQSQIAEVEKKLKDLKIRRGLGDIDKDTYELTFEHLNNQLQETSKKLHNVIGKSV